MFARTICWLTTGIATIIPICGVPFGLYASPSNTVVRIEMDRGTNRLGTVDVELFDQDKPETVRNFLLYTRSGAYSNCFLHRCEPGFVIQGGGFAVTNPLSSNNFSTFLEVTNLGRLTNEFAVGPRLTNTFGTIAMAKIGNDPNSATSQWFFNLADNSANLDNQNGGFTVFGRVLGSTNSNEGTNVLKHFNTLATGTGVVSVAGFQFFSDLPVSYTNSARPPVYRELYYSRIRVLGETNGPGSTPPTIALTAPSTGDRFTNQTVLVTGTADDDRAVARIIYRHQGGAVEIASGTNEWQFGISPRPGFNTVSVESIDWDGNHSTNVSVTFFYASQLALDLQATGKGKVEGLTNGQLLQVGSAYAVTAKPAKGYFFDGWSGSVTSSATALSFQVGTNSTNFTLVAKFTRDFFPILAGSYQGLIRETNATATPGLENTGFMTLALNSKGGFSGRIRHRGDAYSFTGRFDRNGSAFMQGTIGGFSRSMTLRLNTTNELGLISGSVSGGSSPTVEASLARLASGKNPATNASPEGVYPFAIPPPNSVPSPLVPGGNGFGRATVTRNGTLGISGTLGDGTPFTATARPSRTGGWPFYLNMAKGQAAVQGWITPLTNDVNTIESRLAWTRAFDVTAATYPAGFSNQVALRGLRLVQPEPGHRYLNWVTGLARIDGANLVSGVTNTLRFNVDNTITVADPNPATVDVQVNLNTGMVDGSFVHPWLGTTNALHGVLFKPGESIRGQFRDGNQTGSLNINVAPFLSTQILANVTLEGFNAALSEGGLIRFDADADLILPGPITPPYDTALDANGHTVRISGAGLTQLFIVPTNQLFFATGVTFADGNITGANGTDGDPPVNGGDACGAGILNSGGTIGFTNCVFTNFVVVGGTAGVNLGTNDVVAAGGQAFGGAVCNRSGRAAFQDCLFVDTMAMAGDGGAWPSTNRLALSPGTALGGAIFSDGSEIIIQGTTFLRSQARGGNPISLSSDGSVTRSAPAAGGAVAVVSGNLRAGTNVFLTNLAVTASVNTNSAGLGSAFGGAMFIESNVTAVVRRSIYTGNRTVAGAALVSSNAGSASGGAIYTGGALQLIDSSFDYNTAQGSASSPAGSGLGGAIAAMGSLSITNSTLHHNRAEGGSWTTGGTNGTGGIAQGGGIYSARNILSMANSTLAFNEALGGSNGGTPGACLGGAIAAVSNSTLMASLTIAYNSAGRTLPGSTNSAFSGGGGIANLGGTVALRTSLMVSNAPANFSGALTDISYNFSSDASVALTSTTGATNVDVLLGPLTDNGGPTLTMGLGFHSPARDKVPPSSLSVLVDQRSISRPQPVGGLGDAGAVEEYITNAAPIFITSPSGTSVHVGESPVLQGEAVATSAIVYAWFKDGQRVPGGTNSILTLVDIQVTNAGNYVLVATNLFGAATSDVATVIVDATPFITTQPISVVVNNGQITSFSVGASPPGLFYFWYRNGVRVGTNAPTLTISSASPADRGSYFAVVSNAFGTATSQVATLTFNAALLRITTHPTHIVALEGQDTNFTVSASSSVGSITYQWFFAGSPLDGQTNSTLLLTNVSTAHVGTYHVVLTNAYLSVTSNPATLSLNPTAAPVFTRHPTGAVVRVGSNYTFQAFAVGTAPIDYSWTRNGQPLGATGVSLSLTNVQMADAGSYRAMATNNFGTATSLVAMLTLDFKPRILVEPADLIVSPDVATNFGVVADGPDLTYAWWHNGAPVAQGTNETLSITNAAPADRGSYQVVLTNSFGSITSRMASLSFDANALAIVLQPTNVAVTTGQTAQFVVTVAGIPPFSYQWTLAGGGLLADETNDTLMFASVSLSNAGNYQVTITNAYSSVTSVVATLTVDTNIAALFAAAAGPRLVARVVEGQLVIECFGTPGVTYCLVQAESTDAPMIPSGPAWLRVISAVMPTSRKIVWTLPLPTASQTFYRAFSP
jgi:cyclophilin family peptidyl-prolyl cis-trans isomerase